MESIIVRGISLEVTKTDVNVSPLFQLVFNKRYDNFSRYHKQCNRDTSEILRIKSTIRDVGVRINPKARIGIQHYIRKECIPCVLQYLNDGDIATDVIEQIGVLPIIGYHNGLIICGNHNGWMYIESHGIKNLQFTKYLQSQHAKNLIRMLDIEEPIYKKFGKKWTHPMLYKSYRMWCDPNYAMEVLCQAPDPTESLANVMNSIDNNGRAKPGVVYFIGFEDDAKNEYIKIGRTSRPIQRRITQLQCGHPTRKLKLIKTIITDDVLKLELELHTKYDEYRCRGEWFKLPEHIKVVDQI